jgi:dTDP-4-amino-4,6-dideoxygalactose transaminase
MTMQTVPFLDLVTPHRELEEELVQSVRDALRSAAFIGGPQVEAFEAEFAKFCGADLGIAVSSGTDALRFALTAAGVKAGDAVLTVAHTFIATVEAISQAGAATEFVDVDERTYTLSPARLEEYLAQCAIDPASGRPLGHRTRKPISAIVPVHLYGQMADMKPILELADRYGLVVVEDACQAHGAEYLLDGTWRRAGSVGHAAAFSFYPGKNLGACGEGGAVTTNDPAAAKIVRMLRDHGQVQKYYHDLEGYNGRLDAIQAAFLRIKLRHLASWNEQRRAAARTYAELLAPLAAAGIAAPYEPAGSRGVYHLYVIRTPDRDGLAQSLKGAGIGTGLHYPVPVHLQKCYRDWGYRTGSLPATEKAASEILSLPMFPNLTPDAQQTVVEQLRRFVDSSGRAQVGSEVSA